MEERLKEKIRPIHRVNRLLWLSILSGIVTLNIIIFIFHYLKFISPSQLQNVQTYINILLMIAAGLLFLVMYVKRTYLIPSKLIERAKTHDLNITSNDVVDFIQTFGDKGGLLAKAMIIMRRYYMVIWSIANLIVMIGFIQYIIDLQFQSFLIYSIVGIFSLSINFPRFAVIETLYLKIKAEDPEEA